MGPGWAETIPVPTSGGLRQPTLFRVASRVSVRTHRPQAQHRARSSEYLKRRAESTKRVIWWCPILILGLCLCATYIFGSGWPRRFEPVTSAAAYRAGFAKPRLIDVWGLNRATVPDAAVDHRKIIELFRRLSQLGSNAAILDYRPENKERCRSSRNKDSLVQGFHFVMDLIDWRTHCIEGYHRPSLDQFRGRPANIFHRPRKADITIIQQAQTLGLFHVGDNPRALGINHYLHGFEGRIGCFIGSFGSASRLRRLPADYQASTPGDNDQPPIGNGPPIGPFDGCVPPWRVATGFGLICLAVGLFVYLVRADRLTFRLYLICCLLFAAGSVIWLTGHYWGNCQQHPEYHQPFTHGENVSQKPVDAAWVAMRPFPNMESPPTFCGYYGRFLSRLAKDATPWARDNIGFAGSMVVAPLVAVYVQDHNHVIDWVIVKTTAWIYLGALVIYTAYHLIRTPWKLDVDESQKLIGLAQSAEELAKTVNTEIIKNQEPLIEGVILESFIGPATTGEMLRSPASVVLFAVRTWNAVQMPDIVLLRYGLKVTVESPDGQPRTYKGYQVQGTISLFTMQAQGSVRAISMQREVLRPQRYMYPQQDVLGFFVPGLPAETTIFTHVEIELIDTRQKSHAIVGRDLECKQQLQGLIYDTTLFKATPLDT